MPACFGFGVLDRVGDLDLELLSGFGAAQGFGEGWKRLGTADFYQGEPLSCERRSDFAIARLDVLNQAAVADVGPVAVDQRAVFFDRLEGGAGIHGA